MHDTTRTFFALTKPVFVKLPKTPYLDPIREKALKQLQNLVDRRGFAVLAAPPGCGKPAILHYLCDGLSDNHHQVIYVPFSFLEKGHMLQFISARMGLQQKRGMATTLRDIHKHLSDIQPVNPVIVLDEAQRLELATTHIFRLIANDRPDTVHYTTLIFAGVESFIEQTLRLQVNEPLRQRITLYCYLRPFDYQHTTLYIKHHLTQAGAQGELFQAPALHLIQELTNGVPRIINTLAEGAMDIAAENKHNTVSLEHVQQASQFVLIPQRSEVLP